VAQDGLKFLARTHQLAQHEVGARELQAGAVVVRELDDVVGGGAAGRLGHEQDHGDKHRRSETEQFPSLPLHLA
jgi:hypothetical protein